MISRFTWGPPPVALPMATLGGLRRVGDGPPAPCLHPEHSPPSSICLEPGDYEYACPACGRVVAFNVGRNYC